MWLADGFLGVLNRTQEVVVGWVPGSVGRVCRMLQGLGAWVVGLVMVFQARGAWFGEGVGGAV